MPHGSLPIVPPEAMPPLPPELDEQGLFRTLFGASPDALLVADAKGRIVLANPAAAVLLGYSIEQLTGMNVDELVPDGIRPRHAAYREAYAHNPKPRPMGMQTALAARRSDGSEVTVEIALSPLQSHGLPLVMASIRDIGAYPRVKQALQRARYSEHLAQLGRLAVDARDPQDLLQQLPQIAAQALQVEVAIVYLLDADRQNFRVAGGVGLEIGSGHGSSAIVGQLVPLQQLPSQALVLLEGTPLIVSDYRTETRFAVPPAYLQAGLTSALAVPLSDRGRTIGVLAVRSREAKRFGDDEVRFLESLSNLLASSLQRVQSEEALNHAQRLESVGQLTGGIAHDFNNLLTVIQGNLQVLEELPALTADSYGPQLVAAATRATRRAAELTGKLLAFSRRQVLQPAAIDLNQMLNSLADMLRRTLDQRIAIELKLPQEPLQVQADPVQLESALLNLAINSRDAMPGGGTLHFSAEHCLALPAEARTGLDDPSAADDAFIALAISDTGSGMSEEVKERAFEPFFTTKEAGRGTGLGLSTVYGFVKQSKGTVTIDSTPGQGTTLTLYIPRPWRTHAPAPEIAAESGQVPPGLRVLMVEDDSEVRTIVHNFLQTLQCHVTSAASGEQALLALNAAGDGQPPLFDLLLSDIALGPGMRGTELARLAQERLPQMAVLLMSGYSAELLEADRESPPAWELLRKPYSRDELAQAIARVIGPRG